MRLSIANGIRTIFPVLERLTMRLLLMSLLLPLSLALAGCGLASFDIPITDTVTVEAGAPSDEQTLELPEKFKELRLNATKEFGDSGFGIKDVESVKLTRARIKVLTPGANLDFLTSARFFVQGPAGSGLENKVEIGSVSNIAPGSTSVSLSVKNTNLKEYAMLDSMTISAEADRGELEEAVDLEVHAVFHVEVF